MKILRSIHRTPKPATLNTNALKTWHLRIDCGAARHTFKNDGSLYLLESPLYTGHRDHAYDLNGNRTTDGASAPGSPTTATDSANTNRIATINGAAVTLDAAGQITNDGVNSYTWDDAGRLKTVSRGGPLRSKP